MGKMKDTSSLYWLMSEGRITYKKAQAALADVLKKRGWELKDRRLGAMGMEAMKVPHITSPNGKTRLWFKKQAIWKTHSYDGKHDFRDARSLHVDIRNVDLEAFADELED
jgi:hypothetical protein